ncbi:integrase [Burkholderia sp. ABCPW 111]|uniref:integrase n=1 Tax=Burkholderia sp. ABCPW 111 TaxID=1820025 RepID=UPI0005310BBB|nr:site-specific integrase [Burkholderia sp. ABCPW 111]KGR93660.1 phage integrase family protein [Burkholderia sp. ABCPW 111]
MSTIIERAGRAGKITYQAKIRKVGYPLMSRTFRTRAEAVEWAKSVEDEIDRRERRRNADESIRRLFLDVPPDKLTLGDLLCQYRDRITPHKRSAEAERWRIGGLLKHPLSYCSVSNLSTVQVAEWRDDRLKEVSGSTVNRDMNLLGHVIEIARSEWGVKLDDNPFQRTRRPKHNPPRERRLSKGEEARLLNACPVENPYLRPAITLAVETGMRLGEITGLEWSRINLTGRAIHLTKTKTGVSRGVALSMRAVETLARIREQQAREGSGDQREIQPRVFPGVTPEALKRSFIRAVARAKIVDLHFHDLRHEAVSRMFEKGLPAMEVATVSGHQTLQLLRRYTHLQLGDLARKLDKPRPDDGAMV